MLLYHIQPLGFAILCHFIGDYFLQTDYIAKTKGKNWWHLIVHCVLYMIPFIFIFSFSWKLIFLFVSHFLIDMLKARYKLIDYFIDQVLHLVSLLIFING